MTHFALTPALIVWLSNPIQVKSFWIAQPFWPLSWKLPPPPVLSRVMSPLLRQPSSVFWMPTGAAAAAGAAGLDMARARQDAASEAVSTEIAKNLDHARALGFTGTPAWIAGKTPFGGAVGYEKLKAALAASTEAR